MNLDHLTLSFAINDEIRLRDLIGNTVSVCIKITIGL
jgi:hypothetical protein